MTTLAVSAAVQAGPLTITRTNYHGWDDAVRIDNGQAEVVVVPAIGRIMRLGFAGGENVIWENRELDGRSPDGRQADWLNLGGDKAWPSPQADWVKYTGCVKDWPPPRGFDGLPATASVDGDTVILTHPVDVSYGLRAIRRITLDPAKPVLTVRTTFERGKGGAVKAGVWVITQFNEPAGLFLPLPERSIFPAGYVPLPPQPPPHVEVIAGPPPMLSLRRDPGMSYKIGLDGSSLIWVGQTTSVRIDSPRVPGGEYPDKGSSTQVYSNAGDMKYVELETLGPLTTLKAGDTLERTNVYTLRHRTETNPLAEAVRILGE